MTEEKGEEWRGVEKSRKRRQEREGRGAWMGAESFRGL